MKNIINQLEHKIIKPMKEKLRRLFSRIINKPLFNLRRANHILPTEYSNIKQYIFSACDLSCKDLKVLYVFPIIDWNFRFQRPQHLVRGFAQQEYKIFYFTTSFNHINQPGYSIRSIENNVFEIKLNINSSINIYTQSMTEKIQDFWFKSIARFEADFGIVNKMIKLDHPFWISLVRLLNGTVIYDCMDDHEGFNSGLDHILLLEQIAVESCDILVVSSENLYKKFSGNHKFCVLIENACDYDFFSEVRLIDEMIEFKKLLTTKPVIGYFGAISNWFDWECLEYLIESYPDYQFILIGRIDSCERINNLKDRKNIHLLGEKPYTVLPAYLDLFDVCLIPFKIIPLTLATNPVKMFEYLAQGKAVVSTELPEVLKYSEVVYTAKDKFEFAKKIELALSEKNNLDLVKTRIEVARNNSWNRRFRQLINFINLYKPVEPCVSVIVLTYNNLNLTKACLYSLYKYSYYNNLEIIVVDNMSNDGSREWLSSFAREKSNLKLILNSSNMGFSAGNNIGIKEARGDYIVMLNNDTFVSPHWISLLIRHFSDRTVGMVGPVTNNIGNQAKIILPDYYTEPDFIKLATLNYYNNFNKLYPMQDGSLAFFCVAIRREVINKVGLLDEKFGLGWFEDDDYTIRVRNAGYTIMIVDDVLIHHEHSASFGKLNNNLRLGLFNKNKLYFEQKHNMKWVAHVGTRNKSILTNSKAVDKYENNKA